MITDPSGRLAGARVAVLAAGLSLFVTAIPVLAADEVVIGVIEPLSGPNAQFGVNCQRGIELAADRRRPRQWLVMEPRMTGQLLVAEPPTIEHVRLELAMDSRRVPRLIFWDRRGLGTVRLFDEAALQAACGPHRLGIDGLVVTPATLHASLGRSRRAVKPALLDQRAVAGIGNIYAAEILHAAGIDPRTQCRRLSLEQWDWIASATRRILAKAVRLEGSTIGDATYKTADNRAGRFQRHHRVYGREGEPCIRCGEPVKRIVQAQRSTFFCPRCQWRQSRGCHSL